MLAYAYENYGNFFWLLIVAAITYFAVFYLKNTFVKLTAKIKDDKTRSMVNLLIGCGMSIAVAYIVGKFGCLLFGVTVPTIWFVASGFIANYAHNLVSHYAECELLAFAKTYKKAIEASNLDISEADIPTLTAKIGEFIKAYATSNNNVHAVSVSGVAKTLAAGVGISEEEVKAIDATVANLEATGRDVTVLKKALEQFRADGIITGGEKAQFDALVSGLH